MEQKQTVVKPTSPKQPYHHWFAGKYCDGSRECAEALRLLIDTMEKTKKTKPFLADLTKNLHLIQEELKDPEYYEKAEKEIHFNKVAFMDTYEGFVGYKKMRMLALEKLAPSVAALENKNIVTVVEVQKTHFEEKEKPEIKITPVEMKVKMENYFSVSGQDYKIQDNTSVLQKMEVVGGTYAEVEKIKADRLSVENKVSADVVLVGISKMKENILDKQYTGLLKRSIGNSAQEIPIPIEKEGKKTSVSLVLPLMLKNFMNVGHYVNSQDISEALVARMGIKLANESPAQRKSIFFKDLEQGDAVLLFNDSWLEKTDLKKIRSHCPLYTGLQGCPWLLIKMDKFAAPIQLSQYKVMLSVMRKIAKYYAVWIRGGMTPTSLIRYLKLVLGLNDSNVVGKVITVNIQTWMQPVKIEKYRESSISIKDSSDLFGIGDLQQGISEFLAGEDQNILDFQPFVDNVKEELKEDVVKEVKKEKPDPDKDKDADSDSDDKKRKKTKKKKVAEEVKKKKKKPPKKEKSDSDDAQDEDEENRKALSALFASVDTPGEEELSDQES